MQYNSVFQSLFLGIFVSYLLLLSFVKLLLSAAGLRYMAGRVCFAFTVLIVVCCRVKSPLEKRFSRNLLSRSHEEMENCILANIKVDSLDHNSRGISAVIRAYRAFTTPTLAGRTVRPCSEYPDSTTMATVPGGLLESSTSNCASCWRCEGGQTTVTLSHIYTHSTMNCTGRHAHTRLGLNFSPSGCTRTSPCSAKFLIISDCVLDTVRPRHIIAHPTSPLKSDTRCGLVALVRWSCGTDSTAICMNQLFYANKMS